VALYGPPAAGKDTVTAALATLDERYVHFDRLKVGTGTGNGYRYTTAAALARLRAGGLVVYENSRYGNTYAVDRPRLDDITGAGRIPVVHLGQVAGITALRTGYPARWLTVLLWCPRDVSSARLRHRGSSDIAARLQAWDETRADLTAEGLGEFTMAVRTDHRQPEAVADAVHRAVTGTPADAPPICDPTE
jgi:guanylate kinase